MMSSRKMMTVLVVTAVFAAGCNKDKDGSGGTPSAQPAAQGATPPAAAPALPAKGPWEAAKITALDKKDPSDGSPYFKIANLGGKTISAIFVDFYGYDAKGKQVVHQERDVSLPIKGGSSYETYTKPSKDVTTWEATYHGIQFDGEQLLSDPKRAPATRPKGG